jgi:hypothetical protein
MENPSQTPGAAMLALVQTPEFEAMNPAQRDAALEKQAQTLAPKPRAKRKRRQP